MSSASWMATLADRIGNRRLNDLALPGTHDAGSGTVRRGSGVTAAPGSRCFRCVELLAPGSAMNWVKAQGQNIEAQLVAGIRYFDLCLYYDDEDGDLFVTHPFKGDTLRNLVDTVRSFLARHPREIVLLDFSRLINLTPEAYAAGATTLATAFGDMLAPPSPAGPRITVQELWDRDQRVVILYPETYEPSGECRFCGASYLEEVKWATPARLRGEPKERLWARRFVSSEAPRTTDLRALRVALQAELSARPDDKWFVLSGFITPDECLISEGQTAQVVRYFKAAEDHLAQCIPGFLREATPRFWRDCVPSRLAAYRGVPESLQGLANDVTPEVVAWIEEDWRALGVNVVLVDWFEVSNFVDALIRHNAQRPNHE